MSLLLLATYLNSKSLKYFAVLLFNVTNFYLVFHDFIPKYFLQFFKIIFNILTHQSSRGRLLHCSVQSQWWYFTFCISSFWHIPALFTQTRSEIQYYIIWSTFQIQTKKLNTFIEKINTINHWLLGPERAKN